jgi:hypothetical protein
MAWPITFTAEWVLTPFFGLFFLIAFKGRIAQIYSIFFFMLSLPLLFGPQYFLLDNGTVLTEVTLKVYPTPIILLFFVIHITLISAAIEILFTELDRNWYGKPNPKAGPPAL